MGVLIHFTNVATYVYVCKGGQILCDDAGVYPITDLHGIDYEVSGNVLSFEVKDQQHLEEKLTFLRIKGDNISNVPVVEIMAD